MSRMLMALGVVTAFSLFSTEVTAAALPPFPPGPGAVDSVVIVPGNVCKESSSLPTDNLVFSPVDNSVSVLSVTPLLGTPILCSLPRIVTTKTTAEVTVVGQLINPFTAGCIVISSNGPALNTGVVGTSPAATVQVNPESSLSLQCSTFGSTGVVPVTADIIRYIKVKT